MTPDLTKESIRIGTMAGRKEQTAEYIRQILPHGFESFQINFWQTLGAVDLRRLADEVGAVLAGSGAIISALGIYGNPLEGDPAAQDTIRGWESCIDHARLFGTDLVCGFAGRLRGKPVPESLPRFQAVFGELVRRAADQGVRLAFENCWMGGTWQSGDWNIALSPDAWELMFDALPAAQLGLEWEPCHQLCELIDPLPQLRTWVPKIFHVHGKDATVYWDVIRRHGVKGPLPGRASPSSRLWRQQLDRHHQRAAPPRICRLHRPRGLARSGLPGRPRDDRPGRRAALSQALSRRILCAQSGPALKPDAASRGPDTLSPSTPSSHAKTCHTIHRPMGRSTAGEAAPAGETNGLRRRRAGLLGRPFRRRARPPRRRATCASFGRCCRTTACRATRCRTTWRDRRSATGSTSGTRRSCPPRCGATATRRACGAGPPGK